MPLETATYISDLNASNPIGATDPLSSADDHLRLLKSTIKTTFPSVTGAVTPTHTAINQTCVGTGGTFPAINGSALTALNATALASGTVADGRLSANVPLLNATNVFTQAATNEQTILTTVALDARLKLGTNSTTRAYIGAPGAANNLIPGAAVGDLAIRIESGVVLFSVDGGSTAHWKVGATAAVSALHGIAVSDFARLSQANVFTAQPTVALASPASLVINANSAGANDRAYVTLQAQTVSRGYVGVGDLVIGATRADLNLRVEAGGLFFSGNGGSTAHFALSSAGLLATPGASASEVGWQGTPPNTQNGNYTLVIGDRGGLIRKQSGAGNTITIPANASVSFPDGTIITIDNDSGNAVSIAITTDVLELAGTGTTGTRTLSDNGSCSIQKIASTKWRISGTGVS
jgi:hypothetical protein